MPISQFDVGLDDLGTGVEKIFQHLSDKRKREIDAENVTGVVKDFQGRSNSSTDDVVDGYLNAALKYADSNPELAREFVTKAFGRSANVYDANLANFEKNPKNFVRFHDDKGRMSIAKAVAEKEKEEKRTRKLVEFLADKDPRDIAMDVENSEYAVADVSLQESLKNEDATDYINALKYIEGNKIGIAKSKIGAAARNAKTAEDFWNNRLKSLQQDKRIRSASNDKAYQQIQRLNEQKAKLQSELIGNDKVDMGSKTAIADIDAKIETIRAEIADNNMSLQGALSQELAIYDKKKVLTPWDKDRKTIIHYIQQVAAKKGMDQAVKIIDRALKDPKSSLQKKLTEKHNSLTSYEIDFGQAYEDQ